ncbi:hypothetical protein [Salinibacter phage M8CRM-1]|uniref:Uncharacterized protein n=3 Tax=Kryptosalinivirus TaxID=2560163 RepID=A0A2I6UGF5_9CAUD|nr:hypothetical protein FGG63_gp54 [Salinibacter phage M8CC-19]YP_009639522.1 hypothetical protein FGG67_gp56 [Salinibacter phage M8CRM-1]AUO79006.1 hypothetical protein [Salinibacter phage M8CC-19]AUO79167.1 hypothetical protein [Salinibacter phage M8CRM-1]AUO79239.1 hypothetical protein [Salinibacter phage M31CC-1]
MDEQILNDENINADDIERLLSNAKAQLDSLSEAVPFAWLESRDAMLSVSEVEGYNPEEVYADAKELAALRDRLESRIETLETLARQVA